MEEMCDSSLINQRVTWWDFLFVGEITENRGRKLEVVQVRWCYRGKCVGPHVTVSLVNHTGGGEGQWMLFGGLKKVIKEKGAYLH